jgi:hypothetical protein
VITGHTPAPQVLTNTHSLDPCPNARKHHTTPSLNRDRRKISRGLARSQDATVVCRHRSSSIAASRKLLSLDLTSLRHCCIYLSILKRTSAGTNELAFNSKLIPNVPQSPTLRSERKQDKSTIGQITLERSLEVPRPCRVPVTVEDPL